MAQVINTNMQSLNAQRNLASSQRMLGNTLERLSTGLRINSAKDDAAGLAISERFTSQIKGLNQAIRNANDGISFSQTAESALSTVGGNLQRIRELAVQASSGSNSAGDRAALNNEVEALVSEINRISLNTEFNGKAILDGSDSETFFQVGAQQGQMIAVTGVDSRTSRLGTQEVEGSGVYTQDNIAAMASQNGSFGTVSITVTPMSPQGTTGGSFSFSAATSGSLEEAVSEINKAIQDKIDAGDANGQALADIGMRAFLRVDNDGNTTVAVTGEFAVDTSGSEVSQFKVSGGALTAGTGTFAGESDDMGTAAQTAIFGASAITAANKTVADDLDILTRETATRAIGIVDGALNQINSLRAEMGAVQTRFETAISNLSVGSDNMSAARSRIRDADFAAETAELTRVQILQQAGISVLSQANSSPQSALALLQ